MSEPKLISPLLDNFAMGGPISDHHGIQCCPAMENNTDDKYIVKFHLHISSKYPKNSNEYLLYYKYSYKFIK